MTSEIAGARELRDWLFGRALPLWWENGADRRNGGFEEQLDMEGRPVAAPRRARVQARQIYVYATAGALGWPGPWRAAMDHGLDYLLSRFFRFDGLVRALVSPEGRILDDEPRLYDQAFALLALAAVAKSGGGDAGLARRAKTTLRAAREHFDHDGVGLREADPLRPFQSNPHMHLLEASLAWCEIDPDPLWSDLADAIVELASSRFIDREGGMLREFFDEQWRRARGADGRIVEPGHQFEWAWLLLRWSRSRQRPDAEAAARRLFEIGRGAGVDRRRNVAVNALDDTLAILDGSARLWPQTERMKATVAIMEGACAPERERLAPELVAAIAGLQRYLTPAGAWRDKLSPEGRFTDEPAPASSFYHIVCAVSALPVWLGA
ncbi:MAG TPA: AGE family epimerase/isomerase [Caulobacteraceae bacterium]|nr:AGE family epimerase/isomerase [Caulobacteraceae bacterium]